MQKVLYANLIGDVSGAENSLLSLIKGLEETEFKPLLVCSCRGLLTELAAERGVPFEIVPVHKSSFKSNPLTMGRQLTRLLSEVRLLTSVLRRKRIALVHVNTYKVGLAYSVAGRLVGIPVIWHLRDMLQKDAFRNQVLSTIFRLVPDRIIAVSDACAAQFGDTWNDKIQRIYNGIDADAFRDRAQRDTARRELALDSDTPLIGCVGQLIAWKGQDVFLEAMAKVSEAVPEARFAIVGDELAGSEPFRATLENHALKLGLGQALTFTGFRRDVASLMDAMDVFVHCPVQPDPFPRVILEAMAVGKPIVATSLGGIPELVDDGGNGLLVPPRDAEGLARAVVTLLNHRDEALRMGLASRERVKEFTVAEHVRQVTSLYRELLAEGRWSCESP